MAGDDPEQNMPRANSRAVFFAADWANPSVVESGLVCAGAISADKHLFVLFGLGRKRLGFRREVLR